MSATCYGMGFPMHHISIDESKIQNLDVICGHGYTQRAKEQASEAMRNERKKGRNESPGQKHDLKLIRFGFHNLAVHGVSHKTQPL